jgi:hypothetical protein
MATTTTNPADSLFSIEVSGGHSAGMRSSQRHLRVPYGSLSSTIQSIVKKGGKVVSVRQLNATDADLSDPPSQETTIATIHEDTPPVSGVEVAVATKEALATEVLVEPTKSKVETGVEAPEVVTSIATANVEAANGGRGFSSGKGNEKEKKEKGKKKSK